ncbi:MAG: ABC transporter substrate-binding protein [Pseudomonadota bacterium]|jgi:phospholipid transport system substrate-binding protein|nr:toluene tolerance protein [Alphaproteobacteria bacterium]MEC7702363.1 ABC transporter substrate-binding protein [Pseudomonadota bacterium]MED5423260.1 ABC transporter substrate-binding protein [Pseudomonadota bacterium]|tara:strand:+ start:491 stop:1123 length:633 start_codon:yes stop_codon:yes gene_type:complete
MKSIFTAIAFGVILSSSYAFPVALQGKAVYAAEVNEKQVMAFISEMANDGLSFLSNKELTTEQKKARFKKMLDTSFDIKTIARFALGLHWKSASEKEKTEYVGLFEKMVIDVYSRRFSEYNGQEFEVIGAQKRGKKDFVVTSSILPPEGEKGPDVRVDWRVRNRNGDLRVIDIIVEGISMGQTQRSDFAAVIQKGQGEVEYLLAELRKNN